MKKLLYLLSLIPTLLVAAPRDPNPETPSAIYQNDLDLLDGIKSKSLISLKDGSVVSPSLNFRLSTGTGLASRALDDISIVAGGNLYISASNVSSILDFGNRTGDGNIRYQGNEFFPTADNTITHGKVGQRWSDLRSVLINGADYGFANGWYLREYPATFKDIQTQDEDWMKENTNQGIQLVNDIGEVVVVFGRDGTIYANSFKSLDELDPVIRNRNIPSAEDREYEIERRKEIRGKPVNDEVD